MIDRGFNTTSRASFFARLREVGPAVRCIAGAPADCCFFVLGKSRCYVSASAVSLPRAWSSGCLWGVLCEVGLGN